MRGYNEESGPGGCIMRKESHVGINDEGGT